MKTTAVVESLSTIQPDVQFQRLPTYFKIIKKHLEEDKDLHLRTTMTVKYISCILEFCLLVVFNISDCILSYTSKYSSFNIFSVGPKSNSIISLYSFISKLLLHLFTALMPKL